MKKQTEDVEKAQIITLWPYLAGLTGTVLVQGLPLLISFQKVASEKSAQTLLGEFYKDREFLEQLASDETLQSLDVNDQAESVLQVIRSV